MMKKRIETVVSRLPKIRRKNNCFCPGGSTKIFAVLRLKKILKERAAILKRTPKVGRKTFEALLLFRKLFRTIFGQNAQVSEIYFRKVCFVGIYLYLRHVRL